ncbi:MAG: hypothetical protein MUD01_25230 [Chloroflexaceae bacterium]|jgi:hypothetical protein|nr:hypothetical protein [Chloroflexaceae bacterium]
MYLQARVFIRTALAYLLAALLLGGLVLVNQGLNFSPYIAAFQPVFYHLLTVGWLTQLIFGVALWMFPVLSKQRPRGDERIGWLAYATLNGGLLLRVVFEPLHAWGFTSVGALVLSALLQVVAGWAFVFAIWPRVKGKAEYKNREPRTKNRNDER